MVYEEEILDKKRKKIITRRKWLSKEKNTGKYIKKKTEEKVGLSEAIFKVEAPTCNKVIN